MNHAIAYGLTGGKDPISIPGRPEEPPSCTIFQGHVAPVRGKLNRFVDRICNEIIVVFWPRLWYHSFMANQDDLTGYEEHLRDEATHADYMREAYGDPCPVCRSLRYGGDCGPCIQAQEDEADADDIRF